MFLFDEPTATDDRPTTQSDASSTDTEYDSAMHDLQLLTGLTILSTEANQPSGTLLTTEDIATISAVLGDTVTLPTMELDNPSIRSYATAVTTESLSKALSAAVDKTKEVTLLSLGLAVGQIDMLESSAVESTVRAGVLKKQLLERTDIQYLTYKAAPAQKISVEQLDTANLERMKTLNMTRPMNESLAQTFFAEDETSLSHPIREHIESLESDDQYGTLSKEYGITSTHKPLRVSPQVMGRSTSIQYNREFINKGGSLVDLEIIAMGGEEKTMTIDRDTAIAVLDKIISPVDYSAEKAQLRHISGLVMSVLEKYSKGGFASRKLIGATRSISKMSMDLIRQTVDTQQHAYSRTLDLIESSL